MKKLNYSGIRGTITQYVRLASRINSIHLSIKVKAHQLKNFRLQHRDVTYTPILMKIIAAAAKKYPLMNAIVSRYLFSKRIFIPEEVDISVAMEKSYKGETFVAITVVRSVNKKSIETIASEINYLSTLPYEKLPDIKPVILFHRLPDFLKYFLLKLTYYNPHVFKLFFGTIGFSNLGKFGIHDFYPAWVNTVVFGVGGVEEKPVVMNGNIEIFPILHLSLSFNHNVLDGAMAARIFSEVKDLIERGDYSSLDTKGSILNFD